MRPPCRHELHVPRVEDPGQEAQDVIDVLLRELHGAHGVLETARATVQPQFSVFVFHLGENAKADVGGFDLRTV